jgi:hypothetical protein
MTAPCSIEIQDCILAIVRMKIGRRASPSLIDDDAATPDIDRLPVAPISWVTASLTPPVRFLSEAV